MNMDQTVTRKHFPARHRFWLLATLALLAGCGGELMPRGAAPPAVFLLESADNGATRYNPNGPNLAVSAMRSAAGYDSADMVYVEHTHQLQAFARHRWADSPARMLEPLLVAGAEQSGLFANVSAPASHARAELRLDTELLRLQQVFAADGSRIELSLRASLVDSRRRQLLASQVFRVIEPAEATPYGGVMAANRATALLITELQAFMARALARNSHPD